MTRHIFRFDKLVRDKLVPINEAEGVTMNHHVLDDAAYGNALCDKISEELAELRNAKTKHEVVNEIADLFEVLNALADLHGINKEDIESARAKILAAKGGFKDRFFVETIDIDESHPFCDYYASRPHRFTKVG